MFLNGRFIIKRHQAYCRSLVTTLAMSRIRQELGKLCARVMLHCSCSSGKCFSRITVVLNNEEYSLETLPVVLETFQEKWVKCDIGP
jgi:hypothetical protein